MKAIPYSFVMVASVIAALQDVALASQLVSAQAPSSALAGGTIKVCYLDNFCFDGVISAFGNVTVPGRFNFIVSAPGSGPDDTIVDDWVLSNLITSAAPIQSALIDLTGSLSVFDAGVGPPGGFFDDTAYSSPETHYPVNPPFCAGFNLSGCPQAAQTPGANQGTLVTSAKFLLWNGQIPTPNWGDMFVKQGFTFDDFSPGKSVHWRDDTDLASGPVSGIPEPGTWTSASLAFALLGVARKYLSPLR
jgi:hypothetical protein